MWNKYYATKQAVDAAKDDMVAESADVQRQFKLARDAAIHLYQSGAVGQEEAEVRLSGHANPGHRPIPGGAGDTITVSVTFKPRPVVEPDDVPPPAA